MNAGPKRVILISLISILSVLVVAVAALVVGTRHVVRHPQSIRGVLEKTLTLVTNGEATIEHLDLRTGPLELRLSGFHLTTPPQSGWPAADFELARLSGRLAVEGRFGQRRLVVESLNLTRPSLCLTGFDETRPPPGVKTSPGIFAAILGSLFKTLVFREVVIHRMEIEAGRVEAELGDQRIRTSDVHVLLSADQRLGVSFAAELSTLGGLLHAVAPMIRWESERPSFKDQEPIEGSLTVLDARLDWDDLNVGTAGMEMRLACRRAANRLDFELRRATISGVRLEQGGAVFAPPQEVDVTAAGEYDLDSGQLQVKTWGVEMTDLLSGSGSIHTHGPSPALWSINVDCFRMMLAPLVRSLAGGPWPVPLSEIMLDGAVQISGQISSTVTVDDRRWVCDLEASAEDGAMTLSRPDLSLEGKWSGRANVKGPISDATITSAFKASDISVKKEGYRLNDLSVECSLQGRVPEFTLKGLNIHVPKQDHTLSSAGFQVWPVRLQSPEAVVDLQKRVMKMATGSLTSPLFGELALTSTASEESATVAFRGKSLPWPQWILQPGSIFADMDLSGVGDLAIEATVRWADAAVLKGEIEYGGVGLQDREAIWTGQGIRVRTGFEARLDLKGSKIAGKVWFEVPQGELLLDRYYFNMNQDPLKASGRFGLEWTAKRAEADNVTIQLGELLGIRAKAASGWGDRSGLKSVHVQLGPAPVDPLYERFLKDPFKIEIPRLDEIKVGGVVSADIRVEAFSEGTHRVLGHLDWDRGRMEWEDAQVRLENIHLKLPLWKESEGLETAKGPDNGFFIASSVKLPFVPEQPVSATIEAGPNTLSVPSPTFILTRGGTVRVGETSCRDCFQPTRLIRTSFAFNPIHLAPFLPSPWRNLDKAVMEGNLDPVDISGDTIHINGRLRLQVFGGEILVSNIGAEGLRTPGPKLTGRVDAKALDLARLTEGTEFGKIEGVLQGRIENAVFSRGQPESFDLVLETVKTKGVPQKISVEAVDNIARIGGGTSPFAGIGGTFVSLFRELPYEKIGVRARLENDVFRINGTIREGGKEYLVKRGGLAGVDVVNQNPDNRISFKDMLKRLKRVTSAGAGVPEETGPR